MARMLQHLIDSDCRIPRWKLLLATSYNPDKQPVVNSNKRSLSSDLEDEKVQESKKIKTDNSDDEDDSLEMPSSPPAIVCQTKIPNGIKETDKKEETRPSEAELEMPLELEVSVLHLPDVRNLTESDREELSGFQAAIEVLKEAFEYDSHNERILGQWLDLIYQNRPVDLAAFTSVCDLAIGSSLITEESKLAFMQRRLQILEEFADDPLVVVAAHEEYVKLATAMHNTRARPTGTDVSSEFQAQMYPAHAFQDLLNSTPAVALLQGKLPNSAHAQTPAAGFGPVPKANAAGAVNTLMAGSESFHGTLHSANMQSHYTGGAYDPMARAQGDSSGMPPPTPVVPLMHPPMGDTSSTGVQNEAWRKAAAAMGQQMAQPQIVEHI